MVADVAYSKAAKKKYNYYVCKKNKSKEIKEKCSKLRVDKQKLEDVVLKIITDMVFDDDKLNELIKAAHEVEEKNGIAPRVESLKKSIAIHERKSRKAMEAYLESEMRAWYDMAQEELRKAEEDKAEIKALQNDLIGGMSADDFEKEIKSLISAWQTMLLLPDGRQSIINKYVARIEITDEDPDDPTKQKLRLFIKTGYMGERFDDITAEADLTIREKNDLVHQTLSNNSSGAIFYFVEFFSETFH